MTESDLKKYMNALRARDIEKDKLKQLEALLYEAPSPKISPLPFSGCGGEDRVPSLTVKLVEQQERLDNANKLLAKALDILTFVEDRLDCEFQKEFLVNHYRLGMPYEDIAVKEHRSLCSLYRDKAKLISAVSRMKMA